MRPKGQSWNHDDLEERRKQRMDLDFEYEGKDDSPSDDDDDGESRWTDEAVEVEVPTSPEQLKETLQKSLAEAEMGKMTPKQYADMMIGKRLREEGAFGPKEAAVSGSEVATDTAPNGRELAQREGRFRPIKEIVADLTKEISSRHIKQRKQGGNWLSYIEWHTACRYLDYYAPGWSYEVRSLSLIGGRIVVIARITIPCAEGLVFREATGSEEEDVKGYGDPISNGEAMALKRAAAKFGVGLHLYQKEGTSGQDK